MAGCRWLAGPGQVPPARNPMESIVPLALIFSFIYGLVWMKNRETERRERLKLLEQALRADRIDPQLREQIISALAPEQAKRNLQPRPAAPIRATRSLFLTLGWLTLFTGLGLLLSGSRDGEEAGVIVLFAGLGMITLPIAMRELELRRQA